jgi:uracil-DNA glycosylase family 4
MNVSVNPDLVDGNGDPLTSNPHQIHDILLNDFFYTNVVACRPPDNANPPTESIRQCRSRLDEIIYTVDPILIIAVGGIALETLIPRDPRTGLKPTITSNRGELFDMIFPGKAVPITYPVLAVLHTSYLLRQNDFQAAGGLGHLTYNDFSKAMRLLDEVRWRHFSIPKPPNRREEIPVQK